MAVIEHVVVLMFENRSFDHMLGLLRQGDPVYGGVMVNSPQYSNPADPAHPKRDRVFVTDDGDFGLTVDTPHSHGSVMHQMRPGLTGPLTMQGFVGAYRDKILNPNASHPNIRVGNIAIAGLVLVAMLTALLSTPLVLPHLLGSSVIVVLVAAAIGEIRQRRNVWPAHRWTRYFVAALVGAVLLGVATAPVATIDSALIRVVVTFAVLAVLAGAGAWLLARKKKAAAPTDPSIAGRVMACMSRSKVPALWKLAEEFAVCTNWHCSVPGATWPNRNFAHAGTSDGTVDIEVGLYEDDTIFERLEEAGHSWSIYRDSEGMAHVTVFGRLLDDDFLDSWRTFDDFEQDVAAQARGEAALATYSFIEPSHDGPGSNSQHPGNNDFDRAVPPGQMTDFQRGEQLLIRVYETLRRHPDVFAKTVLVITYDEHGGLYDHAPPPTDAVPPRKVLDSQGRVPQSRVPRWFRAFVRQPDMPFDFKTLGPRVPTVIVSPRIPAAPDPTPYDHAAIPATLRKLFAPSAAPLSDREAASKTFDHLWQGTALRTDVPDLSGLVVDEPAFDVLAAVEAAPRDDELSQCFAKLAPLVRDRLLASAGGFDTLAAETADTSPTAVGRLLTQLAAEHRNRGREQ